MTIDFTEDFEGAADGVTANTTTTGFTGATNNAAGTHSTIRCHSGTRSFRILNPTATLGLWEVFGSPRTVGYQRVYWYPADLTTGTTITSFQTTGSTLQANTQVTLAGVLRLRDASTVVATAATPITAQWYRLEHFVDMAAGTQKLRIFYGANLEGTVPDEEITGTITTGTFLWHRIGNNAANTIDWFFDDYASSQDAWVGPLGGGGGGSSNVMEMEDATAMLMEDGTAILLEA